MFIIKRNQILIVALFALVLVAGVFNFIEGQEDANSLLEKTEDMFLNTDLIIDDEKIEVNATEDKVMANENSYSVNEETKEDEDDIGLATLVEASEDEFFLEAKINRDETREERKEWLMELINTAAQTDETKENAMNEIVEIQDIMEKEMQIESLIEAKGFGNTYVRIDENQIDVVVSKQNLAQNDINQIVDIVQRQTGFETSKIKISSLKTNE